jgi:polar amino acid transport system substrate-binding protein
VLCALLALGASGCAGGEGAAGHAFEPATPGVLTVATAFVPAPGFWQGDPPTAGFEAGLAAALAHHLGLERVKVIKVPFARIVAGHLDGADLALSQLTPTTKREQSLDFSTAYLSAPPGVLARRGVEAIDNHALRGLLWVVSRVSTLTPIVEQRVRPERPPIEVEDRTQALAVLRAGAADALMLDLPVAMGYARAQPQQFSVLAQLSGEESLAAALPDGSSNLEVVDSAIRSLRADGTIDDLVSRWLGQKQENVPVILTEE